MRKLAIPILAVLLFMSLIAGGVTATYTYQRGYESGDTQGKTDGYKQGYTSGHEDGYKQGKTDGYDTGYSAGYGSTPPNTDLSNMLDWLTNSCTKGYDNYYQVVMWRDSQSNIHYSCLVG